MHLASTDTHLNKNVDWAKTKYVLIKRGITNSHVLNKHALFTVYTRREIFQHIEDLWWQLNWLSFLFWTIYASGIEELRLPWTSLEIIFFILNWLISRHFLNIYWFSICSTCPLCSAITVIFSCLFLLQLSSAFMCLLYRPCTSSFSWMETILQCGRHWNTLLLL